MVWFNLKSSAAKSIFFWTHYKRNNLRQQFILHTVYLNLLNSTNLFHHVNSHHRISKFQIKQDIRSPRGANDYEDIRLPRYLVQLTM